MEKNDLFDDLPDDSMAMIGHKGYFKKGPKNIRTENIDLLEAGVDIILHGCNCQNTMGSGLAKLIRDRWPEVYEEDCKTRKGDRSKLGTISLAIIDPPDNSIRFVANCYQQYSYGRDDNRHLNYEAIYKCFEEVLDVVNHINKERDYPKINKIGIPYNMGCGLAKGDWRIIEPMINVVFENSGIDVVICKI